VNIDTCISSSISTHVLRYCSSENKHSSYDSIVRNVVDCCSPEAGTTKSEDFVNWKVLLDTSGSNLPVAHLTEELGPG